MNLGIDIDPNWTPRSQLEVDFAQIWVATYPDLNLHTEYKFSRRRFRFDFCCPESKVAIELQGGIWQAKSGHNTGQGIASDYEKLNLAQSLGWQVYLLTADTYHQPENLQAIARAIRIRLPIKGESATRR